MKDYSPLVSVVVPIYNVESYLHKCVESIRSQTYQHLEIILVDDASTQESVRTVLAEYENKEKVSGVDFGFSDAGNGDVGAFYH